MLSGDVESVHCVPAACPLCRRSGPHPILQRIRHLSPFNPTLSPRCRIHVVRCDNCGMMRLDPRPDSQVLVQTQECSLGDAESQIGSFETGNTNTDYPPMMARELTAAGFPRRTGKILDVGCGSGDLVAAVADILEARATGLEMGRGAVARARRRFGSHRWICGVVEPHVFPAQEFDAVSMIHVLEHLPAPGEALTAIRHWLRPGGILIIEVPNAEFYFSPMYSILLESPKPLLAAFVRLRGRKVPFTSRGFYPFHLNLFGAGSLVAMVESAGLSVLKCEISTCRLEFWLKKNRQAGDWPRWAINKTKQWMARSGLGDNLFLVAVNPAGGRPDERG